MPKKKVTTSRAMANHDETIREREDAVEEVMEVVDRHHLADSSRPVHVTKLFYKDLIVALRTRIEMLDEGGSDEDDDLDFGHDDEEEV